MTAPVAHINLLQRTAPSHTVGWSLMALLAITALGSTLHGNHVWTQAQESMRVRDDVTQQLKNAQARLVVQTGVQAKSAQAVALRKEIDVLQPRAQVAQLLVDAVRQEEAGRTGDFSRVLTAMMGVSEPGLWLTGLSVSAGGKRLELQGAAANGASVLQYVDRANKSLQPLTLRLDSVELQPAGAAAATPGAVSFRLY